MTSSLASLADNLAEGCKVNAKIDMISNATRMEFNSEIVSAALNTHTLRMITIIKCLCYNRDSQENIHENLMKRF